MPRDKRAYLAEIVESCDAIENAVRGLDLAAYQTNRLVRLRVPTPAKRANSGIQQMAAFGVHN